MSGMRNTGYVVSLALLASLVGHIAIHQYFQTPSHAKVATSKPELADAPQIAGLFSQEDFPASIVPGNQGKPVLSRKGQQIIPASDSQEEDGQQNASTKSCAPTTVPAPADALPVETIPDEESKALDENTAAVREVIEWELSAATREEREIWFEELKSLPAGVVSDLLQVRKKLRALPKLLGGMPERLASTDTTVFPRIKEITAEPASQKIRFNLSDQRFATEALEAAISQLRHNVVNAATPGFKRLRVTLVDVYNSRGFESSKSEENSRDATSESMLFGEGCRVGPVLIDMKQGTLKKTENELDLAIEGNGFFVVRRGEKDYLTRCGALKLNRDRLLCLSVFPDDAVLQPPIRFPDNDLEIRISSDGDVCAINGETVTIVGRIQLARVANSSGLEPCGNLVFLANHDSGDFVLADPDENGRGGLRQGFLEQSNVDLEQELAEIDELSTILKAIPQQPSRPATARSLNESPAR